MAAQRSVSEMLLDPGTRHDRICDLVKRRWSDVQRGEYELCLALRRLFVDNVHRGAGIARFDDWVEFTFGMPAKLAGTFNFLGSRLECLPKTCAALDSGRLTYTKAREFITLATPENEEQWIEYAANHTNREIERRVRRKRKGTREDRTKKVSWVDPLELQDLRRAQEILTRNLDTFVPEDKLLPTLARMLIDGGLNGKEVKVPRPKPYVAMSRISLPPSKPLDDSYNRKANREAFTRLPVFLF